MFFFRIDPRLNPSDETFKFKLVRFQHFRRLSKAGAKVAPEVCDHRAGDRKDTTTYVVFEKRPRPSLSEAITPRAGTHPLPIAELARGTQGLSAEEISPSRHQERRRTCRRWIIPRAAAMSTQTDHM